MGTTGSQEKKENETKRGRNQRIELSQAWAKALLASESLYKSTYFTSCSMPTYSENPGPYHVDLRLQKIHQV
jgi:hypothetical protein